MEILFLTVEEVLVIHRDQTTRYGGSLELRDRGLLESALAMPSSSFGGAFLHRDLFEMAAAYLYHLVQNRPFVDGNKRVGAATADVFLQLNGYEIDASSEEYEQLVLSVARGEIEKNQIADFIARHAAKT
ncbi:MAG: death on curing protein [Candidatus Sumerlaeota bacterium]|nr:death on curing protein [Candidatus Sumerlaeota bacterium]